MLLALDGLHPPSMGACISFPGGKAKVTDGPFTEAKEVLGASPRAFPGETHPWEVSLKQVKQGGCGRSWLLAVVLWATFSGCTAAPPGPVEPEAPVAPEAPLPPVDPARPLAFTAIAARASSSLALRADGTVWAWGANFYGQLGEGSTLRRYAPVKMTGLTGITAVAAGQYHSLALGSEGTLWTAGSNFVGQLGDGTPQLYPSPVKVLAP